MLNLNNEECPEITEKPHGQPPLIRLPLSEIVLANTAWLFIHRGLFLLSNLSESIKKRRAQNYMKQFIFIMLYFMFFHYSIILPTNASTVVTENEDFFVSLFIFFFFLWVALGKGHLLTISAYNAFSVWIYCCSSFVYTSRHHNARKHLIFSLNPTIF